MSGDNIAVCLSTFNGARYITEQVESLLVQTWQNWNLWARDDGSTDDTPAILQQYAARYPDKIRLVRDTFGTLGPALSFGRLLEISDGDYFMFCDQDDVWRPDKIQLTLNAMKKAESQHPGRPVLVHSDLKVVDAALNPIAESLWAYQKLPPAFGDDLNKIIIKNIVTGCAMMINNKAKELSVPIPPQAIMHDWWIAMTVARHGKIVALPVPLTLYRQHESNRLGAYREDFMPGVKKIKKASGAIRGHYKMVKKFDSQINYVSVLFRKLRLKFLQMTTKR